MVKWVGKNNILAVIQARGGSKGIPGKNIKKINGIPLLVYTVMEAFRSDIFDHVVVSSDDEVILRIAESSTAYPLKRPKRLAEDETLSWESLHWATLECEKLFKCKYDYVVEIMCTNPLKSVEDIDGVIKKLDNTNADSVVSVVRIWDHHPSRVKYIEGDKLVDFYPEIPESRRQDLTPAAYVRNGSIYATTHASLVENRVRLGPDTRPYTMPEERTINIDEPRDLELARVLLK